MERIDEALARFPHPRAVPLVFSAHSVPVSVIEKGDPYQRQIEETVGLVMEQGGWSNDRRLCYQSKVGASRWLEPSLRQTLRQVASEKRCEVCIVPISFVSDHVETLGEIDHHAREEARLLGIEQFEMTRGLNDSPTFIQALAHRCWQRSVNREHRFGVRKRFRIRKENRRRIPWPPIEARETDSGDRFRRGSWQKARMHPKRPLLLEEEASGYSLCWFDCGGHLEGGRLRGRGCGWSGRQCGQPAPPPASMGICHSLFDGMVSGFFPFFPAPHSFRTSHHLQDRLSLRLRIGCGHEMAAEVSHLGGSQPDRIFVIYARCTHLGCTPDWKASENKFKCPCHGSGYDDEGINFEGPAPRPMDRAFVQLAPDGEIVVDTARLFQWPKGQPSAFNDPERFCRRRCDLSSAEE